MELRQAGIVDDRILEAMERTPRELFVPEAFRDQAYEDTSLPIAHSQRLSQPSVVGAMTQALEIGDRHKVLEVGTGSGYQAAVLARLCRRVYTIERLRELARNAEQAFAQLRLTNVVTRIGDGALGWPEQAPFDRIMVTAAAAEVPARLAGQLAIGAHMVVPIGPTHGEQELVKVTRGEAGYVTKSLQAVRFVPLVSDAISDS
jgi:protein-L-isoaspartate(D-aspartate) O-methyltransferase